VRRRRFSRRTREALLGYALVLPPLLVFGTFVFYPFIRTIWLGFYETPLFPGLPRQWAGLTQYKDVLTSDVFTNSFWVTVKFVLLTVPAGVVLGLLLAVLAHQRLRGIAIFRTIFSSTVITSVAVASLISFTLLNPEIGLLNYAFGRTGELSPLQDPRWALLSVAGVTVWQNLGLSFIVMSAGLQTVPDELIEAARVDGAGAWTRLRRVTIPLLSPTIFFAIVVGTIHAFQSFGQIDVLTQGGPDDRTNVLVYAIYRAVRGEQNDGKAAVLAIALFVITIALTAFQLRVLERRVSYAR
jgi:sn-glycerol 3-phosphate transport system permease protein